MSDAYASTRPSLSPVRYSCGDQGTGHSQLSCDACPQRSEALGSGKLCARHANIATKVAKTMEAVRQLGGSRAGHCLTGGASNVALMRSGSDAKTPGVRPEAHAENSVKTRRMPSSTIDGSPPRQRRSTAEVKEDGGEAQQMLEPVRCNCQITSFVPSYVYGRPHKT